MRKLLERMDLDVENWVETDERYGSIYHRVAGKVENLKDPSPGRRSLAWRAAVKAPGAGWTSGAMGI